MYSTDLEALGSKLADVRKQAGLSQQKVAETIGTSQLTISNWETGKKSPRLKNYLDLLNLFDIDFNDMAKQ